MLRLISTSNASSFCMFLADDPFVLLHEVTYICPND